MKSWGVDTPLETMGKTQSLDRATQMGNACKSPALTYTAIIKTIKWNLAIANICSNTTLSNETG